MTVLLSVLHTHTNLTAVKRFLKKYVFTCVCKYLFAGPLLFEAVHMEALPEVPLWTLGCYARFSCLHSVLLIATDFWKLGNKDCATERLPTSPTFPHSHFQRFQRFWSADWWWRTAGAGGSGVQSLLSLAFVWLSRSWDSNHCYLLQRHMRFVGKALQSLMHANVMCPVE